MNKAIKREKNELDQYEQELENGFNASSALTGKEEKRVSQALKLAATNYRRKGARITIRVYEEDLANIKRLAFDEGLPYQTFITSILHKLSTGSLRSYSNQ